MDNQNRFQKQKLNSDDNKGLELGARATKGVLGTIISAVLLYANKDNIKTLANSVINIIKK